MIQTIIKKSWSTVVLDILAISVVYYLPALTHLTSVPLYVIEPIRIMVLISLIVLNNKKNALLLAVTLPLFSYFIATHPLLIKALMISGEMAINILVYSSLIKKVNKPSLVLMVSIIVSKICYYLIKTGFVTTGLLTTSIVSTSLTIQIVVVVITALLFGQVQKSLNKYE